MPLPESVTALLAEYGALEKDVPLCKADQSTKDLCVFNGNKRAPIHRWFAFKEGFSHKLFAWVVSTLDLDPAPYDRILDPFCGVGTALLSAQFALPVSAQTRLVGVERNPLISFVARTKLNWHAYDIERIKCLLPPLLSPLKGQEVGLSEVPALSTIRNPLVFSEKTLQELLGYRDRIRRLCQGTPEMDFFLLGWAAIIERVSGVRRDGRALRFVQKTSVPGVRQALKEQWGLMLADLDLVRNGSIFGEEPAQTMVAEGDGRTLDLPRLDDRSVDLMVYSPPYLNNIDYTEVYKLELWLTGCVDNTGDFLQLRRKTFRSHPSVRFPSTSVLDAFPDAPAHAIRTRLLDTVPNDKNHGWRCRLFEGYIDDMLTSLNRQYQVVKPGGHVVCVVGNSMHGRKAHPIIVATDLLVASLAELAGFDIVRLQVARQLRRRDHANKYLRETIILLRKAK